jgi:hypothetical protein
MRHDRHIPPLTAFVCWMLKPDREPIPGGHSAIAKHFGCSEDHVRGYLRLHGG